MYITFAAYVALPLRGGCRRAVTTKRFGIFVETVARLRSSWRRTWSLRRIGRRQPACSDTACVSVRAVLQSSAVQSRGSGIGWCWFLAGAPRGGAYLPGARCLLAERSLEYVGPRSALQTNRRRWWNYRKSTKKTQWKYACHSHNDSLLNDKWLAGYWSTWI